MDDLETTKSNTGSPDGASSRPNMERTPDRCDETLWEVLRLAAEIEARIEALLRTPPTIPSRDVP